MKNKIVWISIIIIGMACILFLIADAINFFSAIGIPVTNFNEMLINAVVSVIASVITGALTLLGVYLTIEDNKKEKATENKRLVMPMLKLSASKYDYKWKYIQFDFNFTEESKLRERKDIPNTENITINIENVGQRELHDLYLSEFESIFFDEGGHSYAMHPIIYAGDSVNINFGLYEKGRYDEDLSEDKFHTMISSVSFSCLFKDCLGTCYRQRFSITLFHQIKEGMGLDEKALSCSIDRITIDTAPQEISKEIYGRITQNAVGCGGQ